MNVIGGKRTGLLLSNSQGQAMFSDPARLQRLARRLTLILMGVPQKARNTGPARRLCYVLEESATRTDQSCVMDACNLRQAITIDALSELSRLEIRDGCSLYQSVHGLSPRRLPHHGECRRADTPAAVEDG